MSLTREDCTCPVCLEIFVEPVTLPCAHTFCKDCFLQAVDKASLCCPLCRMRVSSWTRLNSRNQTLVNQPLWTRIQSSFPQQCERRLRGQDGDEVLTVLCPRVSQPGEVRREYEDQILKLRGLEEESERASEELIRKLQQEEEELQQAELQRRQEDEQLARLLSNQLNSTPFSVGDCSQDDGPIRKRKDLGPMDRFLTPCSTHSSVSSHWDSNGLSEASGMKRKREQEEVSNQNPERELGAEFEQEVVSRRQQEAEDHAVAKRLQQQLNDEERRRNTDRRKGSADQYQLRGRPRTNQRQVSLMDMFSN